ncbi:hypothetical protein G8O24_02255 [Bradyrhizobium sp. INPA01-394B]|uniref:DUF748 domain-containing protein n=1 Tax=Bradyrhizobium campsiandrae TaxID=1729892 RepID=A0ABR7U2U0_9BRAD|nr:hypothetical protein [Bradyrhizobium campsiandrae]MBC9876167.1 hypothetical protein [Bradyrhizobium campsiandrae]MBC9977893.1 hypothetical protein [Bradyrhizobium campsiandrae]
MKRILIGLIVAALLAVGGWFGFNLYARHRATAEIEAAFEQIRKQGGQASHGKIGFDLPSRTLTIKDIAVDPSPQSQTHIKIAGVKASGLSQGDEGQFSADTIEISGIAFAIDSTVGPSPVKSDYKIAQATIKDYAGTIRARALPASNAITDLYRFGLEQFSSVSASSVEVPSIAVTVVTKADTASPEGGDLTYSGLAMKNLRQGKVEATKADRLTFTFKVAQPGQMTGELSNLAMSDFDASGMLAALDPEKTNDDSIRQLYKRVSAGTYTVTSGDARFQIDGLSVEDIAVQPSKFRMSEMLAMLPKDQSAPPTPAQARAMLEKLADFYEGLRVGKIEVGKTSIATPQGTGSVNLIRYKDGEIAVEGVDTPSPQGQFRMERFALKSFSAPNLLRWAADLSKNAGRPPVPDQMLALFGVLAGAEIKGVTAPFKNTRKLVTIDTVSLDWGQLIGAIPSKAHVVAKFVTPTDPSDPKQLALIAAGIDKLAIDLDLGAAWTEQSNSFALTPATLDIGGIARAQLAITLGNVPREAFSADPAQFMGQAVRIEAGSLAFSLRDQGGVEAAAAQYARGKNVSRDAARQALADSVRAHREEIAAANPDAGAAVDAIASFLETPGQTLLVKLTPRAKAPLMQLMQLLQTDPQSALAQFRIEASTGL